MQAIPREPIGSVLDCDDVVWSEIRAMPMEADGAEACAIERAADPVERFRTVGNILAFLRGPVLRVGT